jgi:inhibitor of KinA
VVEFAPAYASIGIFFDPAQAEDFERLTSEIASVLAPPVKRAPKQQRGALHEIPVCYEPEFAPDLAEVAARAAITTDEVIRLHSASEYRVHCVGFLPGFPYLGGLPRELATPRRSSPRTQVPAGSVAIGGVQTGIYPTASPGGWNLIGRTPVQLFDPTRDQPALLRAGERVRFKAITGEQFRALSARAHAR